MVNLSLTKVVDGDRCSVYSWYDDEFGYTNSLVEHGLSVVELLSGRTAQPAAETASAD